jgi:hypothetical protein
MLIPGDPMPLCPSCDEIVYETVCKIGDSDWSLKFYIKLLLI